MDTSFRQRRARRRVRGKSEFLTLDDIALNTDALAGGEVEADGSTHGTGRLLMLRVLSAWSRAVGPHLKAVARPASCRQGRVMVDVRDTVWKRELERARPEILSRLTSLLRDQSIRDISFRVREPIPAELSASRADQPTAAHPPSFQSAQGGDLHDHLRRVMARYLTRSH